MKKMLLALSLLASTSVFAQNVNSLECSNKAMVELLQTKSLSVKITNNENTINSEIKNGTPYSEKAVKAGIENNELYELVDSLSEATCR